MRIDRWVVEFLLMQIFSPSQANQWCVVESYTSRPRYHEFSGSFTSEDGSLACDFAWLDEAKFVAFEAQSV